MRSSAHRSTFTRRAFIASFAAAFAAASLRRAFADVDADVRITRIVGFELRTKRAKIAGKNSRLDVHGDSSRERMARIYTSAGVDGAGFCAARKEDLQTLLGRSPAELLDLKQHRMISVLRSQTMPMWDLLGKLHNKPVCELLGAPAPALAAQRARRVPVYDGSIYFADLLPQFADAWQDQFKREIDDGMARGHRAFKIKIGRGAKWMERGEGNARDIAVVRLIRAHAGKDALIAVDANNGYDLEGAKRFIEQVGDCDLIFTEEMFEEHVEQCLAYKQFLAERKLRTLLADGETQRELAVFEPFVKAKAIDILQGDMNGFGIEGILAEAALGRPQDITVAPHNWGSLMGFYQQCQVAAAIDNFYRAEHDPLSTDVIAADGYGIRDGEASVSPAPGFGLRVNEEHFARDAKVLFDLT